MKSCRVFVAAVTLMLVATTASAQRIDLDFDSTTEVKGVEIGYRIDLGLRAIGLTRLEIDAMLDLRDFQKKLPDLIIGQPILTLCGNDTTATDIAITALGSDITISGQARSVFYVCERVDATTWKRRGERATIDFEFTTAVSAELRDNCVFFLLSDLEVYPTAEFAGSLGELKNLARVRALLVEAIGLILDDAPFCPDLPPEIVALDPAYETAGPQEIPEGGLGVALRGSVDSSTSTVIGILKALQREGALPRRP